MLAHSSRNTDSFGVVMVLGFLGGCWSLVCGAINAGFADNVGVAAGRAWPFVLTTLVLWAIGGWAGGQAGRAFESGPGGRAAGIRFQTINSVAVVIILVLMIWKPGA